MKDNRRWIYHATKKPQIILDSEFETFEALNWADTPAKFAKIADFGVDENNEQMVNALGEAMEGVKNAANGALNIQTMTAKKLEKYALEHFAIDLDRRKAIKVLRQEVSAMVGV
jgi:hypothetical protein